KLPTSWSIPYQNGTESQSLAMSTDGGKTWQQYENNPVIEGPPGHWNITGFRDPFFEPLPALDALLGREPSYYAVFGSGIKGVGPRMPLWAAPASDLTKWTFLGSLFEPADNSSLSSVLSTGSYGYNFEVSGFFTLPDEDGHLHYFVNMGTEGGNVSFHESAHWALWNEGHVTRRANGSAEFTPISGGAGDWGLLYALSSFNDTKNDRRVQYGWAPEDITGDGGIFSANQQGFQGALSLPRELFVHTVKNVVNMDGLVTEMGNSYLTQNLDGSFTAQTLGVRPLDDVVVGLRNGSTQHSWP
ncbi:glycosyl hydrolase-like proteins family 32 superfamily, partial [Aureobasidium melanogenum]